MTSATAGTGAHASVLSPAPLVARSPQKKSPPAAAEELPVGSATRSAPPAPASATGAHACTSGTPCEYPMASSTSARPDSGSLSGLQVQVSAAKGGAMTRSAGATATEKGAGGVMSTRSGAATTEAPTPAAVHAVTVANREAPCAMAWAGLSGTAQPRAEGGTPSQPPRLALPAPSPSTAV